MDETRSGRGPRAFSLDAAPGAQAALNGIPAIDFKSNFAAAAAAGRGMPAMLRDVVRLRFGAGKLTSNEYYYYRLWEPNVSDDAKAGFVGKLAQQPMHLACNKAEWKAVAADKLLFHSVMTGAGLPVPELLAIAHPTRSSTSVPTLADADSLAGFLRDPGHYPLFAKPIEGKYSLSVLSADRVDEETMTLRGSPGIAKVSDAADALARGDSGFLIQRRLDPDAAIVAAFGGRLWSVRMFVLLTPAGPILHRATAKIPTGSNPADNYWRKGNLLAALDPGTGRIERVVTGSAESFRIVESHPDTSSPFAGISVPHWQEAANLVATAAALLPGIGTQSWDIAVTDTGPVILEVNFGGDLNLSQLASGRGTLDDAYRRHLSNHGYKPVKR